MLTNQVSGTLTKEEARRQQLLKYQQDAKKYAQKQKERDDKKKAEKWERYKHVDLGTPLSLSPVPGPELADVRVLQQSTYEEEGVHGYIRELERENARLRREEEKRKEKLQKKLARVDAGCQLNAGCSASANTTPVNSHKLERLSFERNSQSSGSLNIGTDTNMSRNKLPFERHSQQSSRTSNIETDTNTVHNSLSQENDCGADEKKKEEAYRQEMRKVRAKMQTLYTDGMRKSN